MHPPASSCVDRGRPRAVGLAGLPHSPRCVHLLATLQGNSNEAICSALRLNRVCISITGCGVSGSAGARVEDMPDEVKEYEARREAERGKAPAAKTASPSRKKSTAATVDPGAR